MQRISLSGILLALLIATPSLLLAQPQTVFSVDEAGLLAAQTGKPVLAIAGSTGCIHCKKMAAELETNRQLLPLSSQFVVLKMDVGQKTEWGKWTQKYRPVGGGIPAVFVVRADGEQIYAGAGRPVDLAGFMQKVLPKAGKILSLKDAEQLEKIVKTLQQAQKQNETEEVVELVSKYAGSGSFAAGALLIDKAGEELATKAEEELTKAGEELGTPATAFTGALKLYEVRETYGKLPNIKTKVDELISKQKSDENHTELLKQAEAVAGAKSHVDKKNWKAAALAFEKVASEFPNTPAAELAAAELPEIQKRIATPSDKPAPETTGDEKRAISYLRLGKLLQKKNPVKAREYFEKAISAAPGTPTATQAEELINSL